MQYYGVTIWRRSKWKTVSFNSPVLLSSDAPHQGYFLQYRAQMSCLVSPEYWPWTRSLIHCQLCDNLFTFRTKLKKVIISIAKQLYSIFPKANMGQKDTVQWHVVKAASKLIKSGDYLRLPDSSSVSNIVGRCILLKHFSFRASTRISFRKFSRTHVSTSTTVTAKRPSSWPKNSAKQSPSMRSFSSARSYVFFKIYS